MLTEQQIKETSLALQETWRPDILVASRALAEQQRPDLIPALQNQTAFAKAIKAVAERLPRKHIYFLPDFLSRPAFASLASRFGDPLPEIEIRRLRESWIRGLNQQIQSGDYSRSLGCRETPQGEALVEIMESRPDWDFSLAFGAMTKSNGDPRKRDFPKDNDLTFFGCSLEEFYDQTKEIWEKHGLKAVLLTHSWRGFKRVKIFKAGERESCLDIAAPEFEGRYDPKYGFIQDALVKGRTALLSPGQNGLVAGVEVSLFPEWPKGKVVFKQLLKKGRGVEERERQLRTKFYPLDLVAPETAGSQAVYRLFGSFLTAAQEKCLIFFLHSQEKEAVIRAIKAQDREKILALNRASAEMVADRLAELTVHPEKFIENDEDVLEYTDHFWDAIRRAMALDPYLTLIRLLKRGYNPTQKTVREAPECGRGVIDRGGPLPYLADLLYQSGKLPELLALMETCYFGPHGIGFEELVGWLANNFGRENAVASLIPAWCRTLDPFGEEFQTNYAFVQNLVEQALEKRCLRQPKKTRTA